MMVKHSENPTEVLINAETEHVDFAIAAGIPPIQTQNDRRELPREFLRKAESRMSF